MRQKFTNYLVLGIGVLVLLFAVFFALVQQG